MSGARLAGTVVTEKAFQEVQRAKRDAADALRRGDVNAASQMFCAASDVVEASIELSGAPMPAEMADELRMLEDLHVRAVEDDARRTAKFT